MINILLTRHSTTLPDVTKTVQTWVYETSTSLCPVTETKTVAGVPHTVVYTSTSLIVVKVPTTIVDYTTASYTKYATTEVYETESFYETVYTTVSAGSTIVLTETGTSTISITGTYTVTKTLEPPTTKATVFVPITLATSVPYTEVVTYPSEVTATAGGSTVYSTIPIPETSTYVPPPSTSVVVPSPTTILISQTFTPSPTSSAPVQITGAASANNVPKAFAFGAMALLALA